MIIRSNVIHRSTNYAIPRLCQGQIKYTLISGSHSFLFCINIIIGRASLARENEAGDNWGQEVNIFHVNV